MKGWQSSAMLTVNSDSYQPSRPTLDISIHLASRLAACLKDRKQTCLSNIREAKSLGLKGTSRMDTVVDP
jgi:hypothetical protein